MRCLVTGGAGFIGSHMCELIDEKGSVFCVWDNLFRGKYDNIRDLIDGSNTFLRIDMADEDNIPEMVDSLLDFRPDIIFHYAAINGTQYFYDAPAEVLETNVACTHNLMKALRRAKGICPDLHPKIVYASSSEVYGEPLHMPSRESDVTYVVVEHDRDSYAASKLVGEFYVKLISQELGLPWIALRLFNVYGPRMVGTKYGQVIPEFIHRLAEGEYPLKILGDGKHTRSFCYVDDNVNFTWDLALSHVENEVFNIGSDEEVTIEALARSIMDKMGIDPQFEFLPERVGDHKRRRPDTSKLNQAIGKRDYISLEDGLARMIASDAGADVVSERRGEKC